MYKALVRSQFDYCDITYHIPSSLEQLGVTLNCLMEKAERIQYQTALAITGAWQGSSRSKLYEELGWESLSCRRWCRRILQIHKIIRRLLISRTKSHDSADRCIFIKTVILSMKYDVNYSDT